MGYFLARLDEAVYDNFAGGSPIARSEQGVLVGGGEKPISDRKICAGVGIQSLTAGFHAQQPSFHIVRGHNVEAVNVEKEKYKVLCVVAVHFQFLQVGEVQNTKGKVSHVQLDALQVAEWRVV